MITENILTNNKYITRDLENTLQTRGINTRKNDMLAIYYLSTLFLGKGNPYNIEDDAFVAIFTRKKPGFNYSVKRDIYEKYLIGENGVGIWPNWKTCASLKAVDGTGVVENVYKIVSKLVLDNTSELTTVKVESSFDFLRVFYAGDENRIYIRAEEVLKDIYEISISNQPDYEKARLAQYIVDTLDTFFNDLDLRAQEFNGEYKIHRKSNKS